MRCYREAMARFDAAGPKIVPSATLTTDAGAYDASDWDTWCDSVRDAVPDAKRKEEVQAFKQRSAPPPPELYMSRQPASPAMKQQVSKLADPDNTAPAKPALPQSGGFAKAQPAQPALSKGGVDAVAHLIRKPSVSRPPVKRTTSTSSAQKRVAAPAAGDVLSPRPGPQNGNAASTGARSATPPQQPNSVWSSPDPEGGAGGARPCKICGKNSAPETPGYCRCAAMFASNEVDIFKLDQFPLPRLARDACSFACTASQKHLG
jgi:hypothetical protein